MVIHYYDEQQERVTVMTTFADWFDRIIEMGMGEDVLRHNKNLYLPAGPRLSSVDVQVISGILQIEEWDKLIVPRRTSIPDTNDIPVF